MDRPDVVPDTAVSSFGGLVWSDGTALWVCRGKSTLTPMQIRGMSDHLTTKEALTEFWGRYLKDEGVAEAVVDWLMPADIRPPMIGALLPEDADGSQPTIPWERPPTVHTPQDLIHQPSGLPVCHCGSGLPEYEGGCPVCYPASKKIAEPPEHRTLIIPRGKAKQQIVASAPVPIGVETGPPKKAVGACEHGATEYFIPSEDEKTTAIVKATPQLPVKEEDRWWDDPESMDTIKGVIGRGTDFQAKWMISFCRSMGLNPFAGEATWSSQFGRPVIDKTGYLAHANRRPEFCRLLSGKVYEGEEFSYNPMTGELKHVMGMTQDPAKFLFAYAIVYRRDRDSPIIVTQSMAEFMPGWKSWSGGTGSARKQAAKSAGFDAFPADKLLSKAERKALAKAFSLGGMSEDDIRDGDTGE